MIFSESPSPAGAANQTTNMATGFGQAGTPYPPASSAWQAFWDHVPGGKGPASIAPFRFVGREPTIPSRRALRFSEVVECSSNIAPSLVRTSSSLRSCRRSYTHSCAFLILTRRRAGGPAATYSRASRAGPDHGTARMGAAWRDDASRTVPEARDPIGLFADDIRSRGALIDPDRVYLDPYAETRDELKKPTLDESYDPNALFVRFDFQAMTSTHWTFVHTDWNRRVVGGVLFMTSTADADMDGGEFGLFSPIRSSATTASAMRPSSRRLSPTSTTEACCCSTATADSTARCRSAGWAAPDDGSITRSRAGATCGRSLSRCRLRA